MSAKAADATKATHEAFAMGARDSGGPRRAATMARAPAQARAVAPKARCSLRSNIHPTVGATRKSDGFTVSRYGP